MSQKPAIPALPASRLFRWRQRLFLLCSRIFVAFYRPFPIFGRLRSSIAVIHAEGELLMIERSDGLGLGFPGGVSLPWESDERSLAREVREETGLEVRSAHRLFSYRDDHEIPSLVHVFWVEAEGELRHSWEGTVRWIAPADLAPRIFVSHAEVLRRLQADGHLVPMPNRRG